MRPRAAGFTLLELMIVITLIAILLTLSVPNLIRAKMVANQTAAVAALKQIASMQEAFRRSAKDMVYPGHTAGTAEYANRFHYLYEVPGTVLGFIDNRTAMAHIAPPGGGMPVPRSGYYFADVLFLQTGAAVAPVDPRVRYAISGAPAEYNLSGITFYYLDNQGVVWHTDLGDNTETFFLTYTMTDKPQDWDFSPLSD